MSKSKQQTNKNKQRSTKRTSARKVPWFLCLMLCCGCAPAPRVNVVTETSAIFDECLAAYLEAHYAAPEEKLAVPDCVERALIDYAENYTE